MPTAEYNPPFTISPAILRMVGDISEAVGRLSAQQESAALLRLRWANRIRTIQGSLAIEGNSLSEEQITAILEGKRVLAPPVRCRKYTTRLRPMTTWNAGRPTARLTFGLPMPCLWAGLLRKADGIVQAAWVS